jgi:hypothetical protein
MNNKKKGKKNLVEKMVNRKQQKKPLNTSLKERFSAIAESIIQR